MAKRKIIEINEDKCNGCGLCTPNCPEGAIQIIDAKARLISDLFCDGLGACIGYCPQGAITIIEREAEEYEEKKVMVNIAKQGKNVILAHLRHLKEHNQQDYLRQALDYLKENDIKVDWAAEAVDKHMHDAGACPGLRPMDFRKKESLAKKQDSAQIESELRQWPVQLMLVPAHAPYLNNSELLIAADCVPFAYANFHQKLLKDKVLLVACPKLDDMRIYQEKLKQIFKNNEIKSVTYAHMEVPCCFGLVGIIKEAIDESAKKIPFKEAVISIQGEKLQ